MSNEKTHRLRDIVTEEVSLVDRGANKKKFAVIKNDDGEFVTEEVVEDTKKDSEEVVEEAEKASLSMTSGMKKEMVGALSSMVEELMSVANKVKSASEGEDDSAAMSFLNKATNSVAEKLRGMCAHKEEKAEEAEKSEASEEETASEESVPEQSVEETSEVTEKSDSSQMDALLASVQTLIETVTRNKQEAEELLTKAADEETALNSRLSAIEEKLGSVSDTLTKQSNKQKAIKRSQPQASNSIVVESDVKESVSEVSWPLDMNRESLEEGLKF
jgi:chromosome segregation ATPase